jgi:hypothetical protein
MTRTVAGVVLAFLVARPAGAAKLDDFARCLTRSGTMYYMASWCPHCARQQKMFGNAMRWVRSVDCSDGCDGVKSYPTWRFKDGSRYPGVATLEFLASRTRCPLDGEGNAAGAETSDDSGWQPSENDPGTRERYIGGAKIIEVPR